MPISFSDAVPLFMSMWHPISRTTQALNSSNTAIGVSFVAPRTGTIDRIRVYCFSTTGTAPSYTLQFEGLSNGTASGTILAANNSGTISPTATTAHTATLTTSVSVTKGSIYAITLRSASADGSNYATFNYYGKTWIEPTINSWPYVYSCTDYTTGPTWSTLSDFVPGISPVYDDDTVVDGMGGLETTDSTTAGSTSKLGCRFTAPFDCDLNGWLVGLRDTGDSVTDWDVEVRTVTGDTLLATPITAGTTHQFVGTGNFVVWLPFSSNVSITSGTDYRILFAPQSGGSVFYIPYAKPVTGGTEHMRAYSGQGTTFYSTFYFDSYTDYTDRLPIAYPTYDPASRTGGGGAKWYLKPLS